jgi:solute:Na+ symporter, SSS family
VNLGTLDLLVLLLYVVGIVGVGILAGRRTRGSKDYLLGARDLPWWALLLSIVATETSAVTFLSVPGMAYGNGLAGSTGDLRYLQLPLGYVIGRLLIVRWLLPLYFRGQIYTAYQVLAARFGGGVQKAASALFLVTRTLADGLRLYLTALLIKSVLPIDLTTAVVGMSVVTAVYTLYGGMRAVVWTDVLQFFVYMVGAVVALLLLMGKLDQGVGEAFDAASATGRLRLFDFGLRLDDAYTFWAGLLGGAVLSIGSHGVDQIIVQRYLAAKSEREAGLALSLSGFVVLGQFAFFLLLGVLLWAFYRTHAPAEPFASGDAVFMDFIVHHLPTGVVGLVIGAVFSAALSSSLNSSASAVVNDFWLPMRGLPPDHPSGLRVAKVATLVFAVLQCLVGASGLGLSRSVVDQVLGIAAFTTGILLGVYALGTATTRVRQGHALLGMAVGLTVDLILKYGLPGALPPSGLAWPWYALVGSGTTFTTGLAASLLAPGRR